MNDDSRIERAPTNPRTCDQCRGRFDGSQWHPATVSDTSGSIYEFCSEDCKRLFLRRS